jgi:hypothetical protein
MGPHHSLEALVLY